MTKKYLLDRTESGFNLKDWINRFPDYKSQVKKLRETLGLTQSQLAKLVDRTPRSIRNIENGEAYPRITTLENIAHTLNADMVLLLVPKEEKYFPPAQIKESKPQENPESHLSQPNIDNKKNDIVIGETD